LGAAEERSRWPATVHHGVDGVTSWCGGCSHPGVGTMVHKGELLLQVDVGQQCDKIQKHIVDTVTK